MSPRLSRTTNVSPYFSVRGGLPAALCCGVIMLRYRLVSRSKFSAERDDGTSDRCCRDVRPSAAPANRSGHLRCGPAVNDIDDSHPYWIDNHNLVFHHGVFEESEFGGLDVSGAGQVEERD